MHPVIQKTLGGLSAPYYFRQMFFGLLLAGFVYVMSTRGGHGIPIGMWFLIIVNTLLYPYSRFVYESIVGFLMGENIFVVHALLMLLVKTLTVLLCWGFAIFVAPIGLLYLYIYHSRARR
ncbi:MAG TPA: hypothetical protein VJ698_18385 [Noviherbaspirillum sp.]|uniref:hypothetical protein n=1 Tax=Noviherbaspirillum sp. TaxID=1926288 RepID=UPI002B490C24|nr:hypothetical protein [Noviherbaspirillum sp.]HJV87443.1 hypothetical protein [Noviherbaspirillum sp.]